MDINDKIELLSYYNNGMSIADIAKLAGVNPKTISKRFKDFGIISNQNNTKRIKSSKNKIPLTAALMSQLCSQGRTQQSIATETGWSLAYVSLAAKRYGVIFNCYDQMRKTGAWDNIEFLKREHLDNNRSVSEIARTCGISEPRMLKRFRHYGIEVRPNAVATKLNAPAISRQMKKKWEDVHFRCKMAIARSKCPRISSKQELLYSILDDLNVSYIRERIGGAETVIGPYAFDCIIPRLNSTSLLIEVQGDYWHSLDNIISNDRSKSTYIEKYHPEYELKYLWEHEFYNKDKVIELLKYWLNLNGISRVDFKFADIVIKRVCAADYKILLGKYHYLPNAGVGGIAYGAYLNDELIAVSIFSPPIRQNISQQWNLTDKEVRELSRFCINPKYQKKNFGSWFLSKCLKQLDAQYKLIVSYCDTTFNHNGALYKACNFKLDGEVRPDYWYVADDGWVMHKKTLYNHAVNMGMKEGEFAEQKGYKKVYGMKKLRFIYQR